MSPAASASPAGGAAAETGVPLAVPLSPDLTPDCPSQINNAAPARTPGALRTVLRISSGSGHRQPVSEGVCRACSINPAQTCGKPSATNPASPAGTATIAAIGASG